MDKIRVSELHGEANYSYADASRYVQYLYEQERNRIELNHYISTCACLSEGAPVDVTLDNIRAINEAISDKISNAWEKILDFIKRMWGKFTNSLNSLIATNNEYLEKYREIILRKPVKFCKEIIMNNLVKGTTRIIRTDVEVINSVRLGELPTTTEDTAAINKVRDALVPDWQAGANKTLNPEGKDFKEWLKDYFKAQDDEITVNAQDFNMTDAFNFCKDFKAIKTALEKDYNNIQKSSNEFISEIRKIQAENKANAANNNASTEKPAQQGEKPEESKTTEEPKEQQGTTSQSSGVPKQPGAGTKGVGPTYVKSTGGVPKTKPLHQSATVDSLVGDWLHELKTVGDAAPKDDSGSSNSNTATGTTAKANIASTTNNKLDDEGRKDAATLADADAKKVEEMQTKANIYIGIGRDISTAKMTAVEFINREYMTLIKAHVAYYVGREGIEDSQQAKTGTDYSAENPKAQKPAEQPAKQEGARLSSDDEVFTEGVWQQFLAYSFGPIGAISWELGAQQYIDKVMRDKKYGKAITKTVEQTVAKAKRSNKNLTEKVPAGFWDKFKLGISNSFGYRTKHLENWDADFVSVAGKYNIAIIHDTNSVKSVKVCLYDKSTDSGKWFTVPAPDTYAEK